MSNVEIGQDILAKLREVGAAAESIEVMVKHCRSLLNPPAPAGLSFDAAFEALKLGYRVSRPAWFGGYLRISKEDREACDWAIVDEPVEGTFENPKKEEEAHDQQPCK